MPRIRYASLFDRLLARSIESDTYSFEGTPCWEWQGPRIRRGYGRVTIRRGDKNQGYAVHRVMAELVCGRALHPDHETIEHLCELPWCINPLHFGIGTRAQNTADMQARRLGRPRKVFKRLVNPATHGIPYLVRALPTPLASHGEACPF